MKIACLIQAMHEEPMSYAQGINRSWRIFCLFSSQQVIPSWSGFISEIGQVPDQLTTIDYYSVNNHPVKDDVKK